MEIETEIEECMNDMIKKIQQKEYNRRWYQKNKEKKRRYAIKWKKNNPDKVRGYDKKHKQSSKGKATAKRSEKKYRQSQKGKDTRKTWFKGWKEKGGKREADRKYQAKHRERLKEYDRKKYQKNAEKIKANSKAWRENNPDKYYKGMMIGCIKKKFEHYKARDGAVSHHPDRGYYMGPGKQAVYLGHTEYLYWCGKEKLESMGLIGVTKLLDYQ